MTGSQRCLDSVHLNDAELDCLIASGACRCDPALDCLCRGHDLAPTRGSICNLIVSLRRRWRRWSARHLAQESFYMALWTRACFARLFALHDVSDAQIAAVFDDARRYHEFLNYQGRGVRRVFCRIPYRVGGAERNALPTPELDDAMEEQRRARYNVWNEAFDRDENRHMGPFRQMKFSLDQDLLKSCPREPCPSCSKKVYLYCTDCHCWAVSDVMPLPRLTLPINVITVAKKKEWAKKCTAVHSCIVAPDHCSMIEFPSQMNAIKSLDSETTMILYPNDSALDMGSEEALPKLRSLKTLIVVDSTCSGARQIMRDPRLHGLPSVALKTRHTTFWKFTHHGPAFLGTIEAIYYFMVDYFQRTHDQAYDGRYDDLMLLYVHQLRRVESSVIKKPLAWQNE